MESRLKSFFIIFLVGIFVLGMIIPKVLAYDEGCSCSARGCGDDKDYMGHCGFLWLGNLCCDKPAYQCKDNDGENIFNRGTVTLYYPSQANDYEDKCSPGGSLVEYICETDSKLGTKSIVCKNGCEDGACIKEPTCNLENVGDETYEQVKCSVTEPTPTCRWYPLSGYTCTNGQCWGKKKTTTSTPTPTVSCGNGKKEGDEECDDGNTKDGDGCSNKCKIEEESCVKEGEKGSMFDGDSNNDVCCAGLEKIKDSVLIVYPTGGCSFVSIHSDFICADCGDGDCGLGENECNCQEDCESTITPCSCSSWKNQECGEWDCADDEMYQIRSCIPSGCDNEKRCVSSSSCESTTGPKCKELNLTFTRAYGGECGDAKYNPIADFCGKLGDPEKDGKVNFDDLMIFGTNYGNEKWCTTQLRNTFNPCSECIKEGELGSFEDVCCEGLKNIGNSKPVNGVCTSYRNPSFVCTNCGDGKCGLGENYCNCPKDCPEEESCVKEGEKGEFESYPNKFCCAGLKKIIYSVPTVNLDGNTACVVGGLFVCADCGDGDCGLGENECNCQEDCRGEIVCIDSDGGKNYYLKGEITGELVSGEGLQSTDLCFEDGIKLRELFCNDEGKGEPILYECPYGCEDGACNEEPTEHIKIEGNYIFLSEKYPNKVYPSYNDFYTGVLLNGNRSWTLINFDLSDIKNKEIKDAELVINKVYLLEGDEYGKQAVAVHKIMEKWDFNTASWNNKPRFDTSPVSSQSILENGKYTFDITQIINYLISDDKGVLLKAGYENEPNLKRFDKAYLDIGYIE